MRPQTCLKTQVHVWGASYTGEATTGAVTSIGFLNVLNPFSVATQTPSLSSYVHRTDPDATSTLERLGRWSKFSVSTSMMISLRLSITSPELPLQTKRRSNSFSIDAPFKASPSLDAIFSIDLLHFAAVVVSIPLLISTLHLDATHKNRKGSRGISSPPR